MNFKRCHICYFGTPKGYWEGIPICEECLSHRMEITEEMRNSKEGEKLLELPKMKPESEWKWWQQVARERAYEMMDALKDRLNAEMLESDELREKIQSQAEKCVNIRKSLLRLRYGFARMCHLFFKKYYPNSKDEMFWWRTMNHFIFKLDKYGKFTENITNGSTDKD